MCFLAGRGLYTLPDARLAQTDYQSLYQNRNRIVSAVHTIIYFSLGFSNHNLFITLCFAGQGGDSTRCRTRASSRGPAALTKTITCFSGQGGGGRIVL